MGNHNDSQIKMGGYIKRSGCLTIFVNDAILGLFKIWVRLPTGTDNRANTLARSGYCISNDIKMLAFSNPFSKSY